MSLAYTLQIAYILWWQLEGTDPYACQGALLVMLCVHSIVFVLESLRFVIVETKAASVLLPLILDIICIVLYQSAIFYTQIVYVNIDTGSKNPETVLALPWVVIELVTYYSQLALAMVFLLYSSLVRPVKPSKAMRRILTQKRHHDYLTSTQDTFQVINYEGTLIMGSLAILQIEK